MTETGSPLSHTAIVARSLEIPAVMGIHDLSGITSGDLLIVNGTAASSFAIRTARHCANIGRKQSIRAARFAARDASIPPSQQDGIRISLGTNINFSEEAQSAAARTERSSSGCTARSLISSEREASLRRKT